MGEYMESLKKKIGYISLKIKHAEKQATMFPSLLGFPGERSSEQEVKNLWTMEEGEIGEDVVMLTPIEERDKVIEKQKEEIANLLSNQRDTSPLQKSLVETQAENEALKKSVKTFERKLLFTRNVTEQKLLENISDPVFYRDDPHLVQVYTATLNEDEFDDKLEDLDDTKDELSNRSRRDKFLASVEKNLDSSVPHHSVQLERLDNLKNQVLERVKITHLNKSRPRSASIATKRRYSLSLLDDTERSTSRPRTASPPSAPPIPHLPSLPNGSP